MRAGGSRHRPRLARYLTVVALTAVLLLGAVAALRSKERVAAAAWPASLSGEIDRAWLVENDPNEVALELEILAARAGIDLVPKQAARHRPVGACLPSTEIHAFLVEVRDRVGAPPSPPIEVTTYLASHEQELDALVDLALRSEEPRWEWAAKLDSPMPNLVGHLRLQRALAARALVDVAAGHGERAFDALETAWRINSSLLARHEIYSVLIGQVGLRQQLFVLREVEDVPAEWRSRLALDLRHPLALAMAADERLRWEVARAGIENLEGGFPLHPLQRYALVLGGPAIRWDAAELAAARGRTLAALLAADPCTAEGRGIVTARMPSFESPRLVAVVLGEPCTLGSPGDASDGALWNRTWQLEVELALTRRILALKDLRSRGPLPAPARLDEVADAIDDAEILPCPSWRLTQEVQPDGRLRVVLDATPPWSSASDPVLTAWTEAPR